MDTKHYDGIDDIKGYPVPICPLNLFFEGDDVDSELCDYDPEIRMCCEGCKPRRMGDGNKNKKNR